MTFCCNIINLPFNLFFHPQPTMSVAFTPTSVIKKMHSDRASEKEKKDSDSSHSKCLLIFIIYQLAQHIFINNI